MMYATDWLEKWAAYSPGRMALREHSRDLQWSYKEMNGRVDALAAHMRNEWKLQPGDRLAVYSKNCAEYVFLFFACIKSGVIMVPLNFRLMPEELNVLLGDAEPTLLLYEKEFAAQVSALQMSENGALKRLDELTPFLIEKALPKAFAQSLPVESERAIMILYTSGTTGLPKGAMINHRMLFWNSINTGLRLNITADDHTQSFAPFFHTGGWNVLLTPFFHHGASHTLLDGFDAGLILRLMEEEKSTLLFGVPTMLQMMADDPAFEKCNLQSVRYAIVGGAPMPKPLIDTWHEKGIAIRQGYGLTEVGPNCFSLHQDDAIRKKGSIGLPNFYIDARVVGEDGHDCEAGDVGELWLKSPVVTPGYWRNPKATNGAITDGWFHTGDMVTRDDEGYYYVVDRKKNMFISGGENVYPAEVEKFLYSHPAIKEVCVIGVPDDKWGEVGKAFVVLKKKSAETEESIRAFCKGRIAGYKTPKHVAFVDELPKNAAGKIDRKSLY